MAKYVIVTGSPFQGMKIIGPFDSSDDVYEYVTGDLDDEWEMVELVSPPEYKGDDIEDDLDSLEGDPEEPHDVLNRQEGE